MTTKTKSKAAKSAKAKVIKQVKPTVVAAAKASKELTAKGNVADAKVLNKTVAVKKPAAKKVPVKTAVAAKAAVPVAKKPVQAPAVKVPAKVVKTPVAVKETKAVLVAPEIKKKPVTPAKKVAKKAVGKKIPRANLNPIAERSSMLVKKAPAAPKGATMHTKPIGMNDLMHAMKSAPQTPTHSGMMTPATPVRKMDDATAPSPFLRKEPGRSPTQAMSVQDLFSQMAKNAAAAITPFQARR